MRYYTRRWIRPSDLNAAQRLFGGQLLCWIDEEAAIFASCQLGHDAIVTRYISEIDFKSPAKTGDVIEFGLEVVETGRTSITVKCEVRKKNDGTSVITIDRMVFVSVNAKGAPVAHGFCANPEQASEPTRGCLPGA